MPRWSSFLCQRRSGGRWRSHPKIKRFSNTLADEIAITLLIITKRGVERIVRAAFEYAKKTGRKSVTIVEKPNVLRETSGLMVRTAREVARDYPGSSSGRPISTRWPCGY